MKRIAKGGGNRGKIEYFLFVDLDSMTLSSEKHTFREINRYRIVVLDFLPPRVQIVENTRTYFVCTWLRTYLHISLFLNYPLKSGYENKLSALDGPPSLSRDYSILSTFASKNSKPTQR